MLMLNRGAIQAGRTAALNYLETLRSRRANLPAVSATAYP